MPRQRKNAKRPKAPGLITLPCSAPVAPLAYLKLLSRVEPPGAHPFGGSGWHGVYLHPGRTVPESELRPGPEYPERPIILECTGPGAAAKYGYILWELAADGKWIKLGTARTSRDEWTHELFPIAHRALIEQHAGQLPPKRDLDALAEKLARFIEKQLTKLSLREKVSYLGLAQKIITRISNRLLEPIEGTPPESL